MLSCGVLHDLALGARPAGRPTIPAWRSDLDPYALPPTPALTLGQRRVLAACLQQFATKGFLASSTRDIAASIGMQSPSLYNHFPSKDAMLAAVVLLGYEHYYERLVAALLATDGSPTAQLSAVVRQHIVTCCEYAGLMLVLDREVERLPQDALATVLTYRSQASVLLEQVLLRGQEAGLFTVQHPETTVLSIAYMGQAAALSFAYREDLVAATYADEFVDLALRIVGAQPVETS